MGRNEAAGQPVAYGARIEAIRRDKSVGRGRREAPEMDPAEDRVDECLLAEEREIEQILADDAAIGEAEVAADDLHVIGFFLTHGPEGEPDARWEEVFR
jgi:hypothetical protein